MKRKQKTVKSKQKAEQDQFIRLSLPMTEQQTQILAAASMRCQTGFCILAQPHIIPPTMGVVIIPPGIAAKVYRTLRELGVSAK